MGVRIKTTEVSGLLRFLQKLDNYAYKTSDGNPFLKTYNEITNYGSNSKVILISDGAPIGDTSGMFWTSNTLDINGSYANKSCSTMMIINQAEKFKNRNENQVFTLWLNLTGSPVELAEKTVDNIQKNLKDKLYKLISPKLDNILPTVNIDGGCAYDPIFGVKLYCWDGVHNNPNTALKDTFSSLLDQLIRKIFDATSIKNVIGAQLNSAEQYPPCVCVDENKNQPWNSLKELSDRISPNIPTILEDNFQKPSDSYNAISIIYADYIHKTLLVEEAIRYSKMPKREEQ